MDNKEQLRRITELTEQIAGLPKGYLSKKTIGGKVYYYHQWSENGVKQSRYLHDSEIAPLAEGTAGAAAHAEITEKQKK